MTRSIHPLEKQLHFTHTEKLLFPKAGMTKKHLLEYYLAVSRQLLPCLKGRPITLERAPEGLKTRSSPRFWQKNTPRNYPHWIPRVTLATTQGKAVDYVLIDDAKTLLYLVNQGTITFHAWLSRVGSLDCPDFVLFDLDPGAASFKELITIAQEFHSVLTSLGINPSVKTSGRTGLHVTVPWEESSGYDESRKWATSIAKQVLRRHRTIATLERLKQNRGKKVYIDLLQNAKGHHAVPPFVVRIVPEATVSTPLSWNEVTPELDLKSFDVRRVLRRIERVSALRKAA
ncbi:MAG: non-homologous end-joining DNA ligase [Bdellovibrionota bacterium]